MAEEISDCSDEVGELFRSIRMPKLPEIIIVGYDDENWKKNQFPLLKATCESASAAYDKLQALCLRETQFSGKSFLKELGEIDLLLEARDSNLHAVNRSFLAPNNNLSTEEKERLNSALSDLTGHPNCEKRQLHNQMLTKKIFEIQQRVIPQMRIDNSG